MTTISIDRRFRGPERSGNGGYTAGRLAAHVPDLAATGPVTVTLRQPPPLEAALSVKSSPGAPGAELRYDDLLIAEAAAGSFRVAAPPAVGFDDAAAARLSYRGLESHPFPGCFVCGLDREPGDGLHLAPGLVGEGRTACIWLPDPSLASEVERGVAAAEFVWAALDCPGGWTADIVNRPMVLGRITAEVYGLPSVGRPCVVVGQALAQEGRKTFAATALYDGDRLLARAEHTWLAVDPTLFN
jgi:hypothetical protein